MKKKKYLAALLFSIGLISTLSLSASAYTVVGSCNNIHCEAVLNVNGKSFRAGTYADKLMANISVTLDGRKEWWIDRDEQNLEREAYVKATIASLDGWSTHHADNNRGDAFDRSIGFKNGSFYKR
ncbi:hypothetical protein Z957_04125 [Clostridium sp. K25]|uniref:hypothetical protein n=1 Tax=Clostridium sp. K25 TaxID=1443109 RepID=UPI0004D79BC4|nr:hypothetical protein [Clostridium sp. K25]KEI09687.1 hypothetical protein Z957_04125 [Clostridium sp. K25]